MLVRYLRTGTSVFATGATPSASSSNVTAPRKAGPPFGPRRQKVREQDPDGSLPSRFVQVLDSQFNVERAHFAPPLSE